MKRIITLSLGVVIGMLAVAPAFAQDNFPDVPANHWAYEALETLKRDGVLVGYPDGKFRGSRLATRYEMAVAIHAAYKRMMSMSEGLSEQLKALEEKMGGGGGGDNGDMKKMISDMQSSIDGMKNWGDDIATLRKLTGEFEKELSGMGADMNDMKSKLGDLDKRVSVLEKMHMPVAISGDLSFYITAGNSRDKKVGMNKEGRIVGSNEMSGGAQTGWTRDTNVYHEAALNLKSTSENGPKWWATMVYGNALGSGGILSDLVNFGGGSYTDTSSDMYIPDAGVSFDTSLVGMNFNASVGRIGVEVSPMLFHRPDHSYYFKNSRWDDGMWRIDGGNLAFNFGGAKLGVFAGRSSGRGSVNGSQSDVNATGFDGVLGAQVGFNLGTFGKVNAAYIFQDMFTGVASTVPNRMNTLGVDANLNLVKGIGINAGYGKTTMTHNTKSLGLDELNQQAYANAAWEGSNWGIWAEYRKIQKNYAALGSWRRIGTLWNPAGIQTGTGMIYFKPSANFRLTYTGEFGETIDNWLGLASKTKIENHKAGIEYHINDSWNARLGYEDVRVKATGGDIRQKWASLGLGYNLGTNAMLNFAYEYGSVNNGVLGWGNGAPGSYRGGFLTSQLTIRF